MESVATLPPPVALPPKGRPREFCTEAALAAALRVFWSKGYEGASLAELTDAMGITRPSLYAAFGNKEALFHKALDLYEAEKLHYTRVALEQPTARAVAEHFMRGALAMQTSQGDPKGCLGVISAMACGAEAESIKADVIARRASSQQALIARFERAKTDGDLPAHVDVTGLTSYLYALLQGMAVQAGSGASRADLERLVETSMAVWPSR
ncbi:TetR/AcrR family transcriptional regulator [Sphingomonas sp. RP10(2022)]|uniref:TetR/AcrR family transcriptional regulator n=1 Tax=Sphingomonas liriopis TaxID=2949094 RepID=A0A9X2HWH3_9SPHN|nr:TetR/AcrR family transcriptional regulator [Sphingomonas liriopis]MCP3735471.1 TetR/AcrR family transcriptional regulator [Sphingomonas liriopis]